jgi:LysM repeat protein
MSPQGHRSRARLLAPIALVTFTIALLAVLAASGTGDGGNDSSGSGDSTTERTTRTVKTTPRAPAQGDTYTVKTGDTLGAIAQKTGVSVETLQELNPALDPQSLVSGQKIKLRE